MADLTVIDLSLDVIAGDGLVDSQPFSLNVRIIKGFYPEIIF